VGTTRRRGAGWEQIGNHGFTASMLAAGRTREPMDVDSMESLQRIFAEGHPGSVYYPKPPFTRRLNTQWSKDRTHIHPYRNLFLLSFNELMKYEYLCCLVPPATDETSKVGGTSEVQHYYQIYLRTADILNGVGKGSMCIGDCTPGMFLSTPREDTATYLAEFLEQLRSEPDLSPKDKARMKGHPDFAPDGDLHDFTGENEDDSAGARDGKGDTPADADGGMHMQHQEPARDGGSRGRQRTDTPLLTEGDTGYTGGNGRTGVEDEGVPGPEGASVPPPKRSNCGNPMEGTSTASCWLSCLVQGQYYDIHEHCPCLHQAHGIAQLSRALGIPGATPASVYPIQIRLQYEVSLVHPIIRMMECNALDEVWNLLQSELEVLCPHTADTIFVSQEVRQECMRCSAEEVTEAGYMAYVSIMCMERDYSSDQIQQEMNKIFEFAVSHPPKTDGRVKGCVCKEGESTYIKGSIRLKPPGRILSAWFQRPIKNGNLKMTRQLIEIPWRVTVPGREGEYKLDTVTLQYKNHFTVLSIEGDHIYLYDDTKPHPELMRLSVLEEDEVYERVVGVRYVHDDLVRSRIQAGSLCRMPVPGQLALRKDIRNATSP
jgi:hypothetical protein